MFTGYVDNARVKLPKDPNACWLWQHNCDDRTGTPQITAGGTKTSARRWMWEQLFGKLPDAIVVFTSCGTPECVNPHHLQIGTRAQARGEAVDVKLTRNDVVEIMRARKTKTRGTAKLLAERYGVSHWTIYDVWRGRSWNGKNQRKAAPPAA